MEREAKRSCWRLFWDSTGRERKMTGMWGTVWKMSRIRTYEHSTLTKGKEKAELLANTIVIKQSFRGIKGSLGDVADP